jgi:hypothetical protein
MHRSAVRTSPLSRRGFPAGAGGIGLAGLLGASVSDAVTATSADLPFINGRRDLVTNSQ